MAALVYGIATVVLESCKAQKSVGLVGAMELYMSQFTSQRGMDNYIPISQRLVSIGGLKRTIPISITHVMISFTTSLKHTLVPKLPSPHPTFYGLPRDRQLLSLMLMDPDWVNPTWLEWEGSSEIQMGLLLPFSPNVWEFKIQTWQNYWRSKKVYTSTTSSYPCMEIWGKIYSLKVTRKWLYLGLIMLATLLGGSCKP